MNQPDPREIVGGFDATGFRQALLRWWTLHKRHFPWRETRDPYRILVAEVLLHRTRAGQVAEVYPEFLREYPNIFNLAAAQVNDLRRSLHSVGLRWRVDLLSEMAREIVNRFQGEIPRDRGLLLSLPGVGPYIAGAIRCFAYGEADPLLDTNTVRVASRLFCLPVTDASRRSQRYRSILGMMVDPDHPQDFNFALLDHAALICRSGRPLCRECPVLAYCQYGQSHTTHGSDSVID